MNELPKVGSLRHLREATTVFAHDPAGRGRRAARLALISVPALATVGGLLLATAATTPLGQLTGVGVGVTLGAVLALLWVWFVGITTKGAYEPRRAAITWAIGGVGLTALTGLFAGASILAIIATLFVIGITTPLMIRATQASDAPRHNPWELDGFLSDAVTRLPRTLDKPVRDQLNEGIADYVRIIKLARTSLAETTATDTNELIATAREGLTGLINTGNRAHTLREIARSSDDPSMHASADEAFLLVEKLADALEHAASAAAELSVSHISADSSALTASTDDLRTLAAVQKELASGDDALAREFAALEAELGVE